MTRLWRGRTLTDRGHLQDRTDTDEQADDGDDRDAADTAGGDEQDDEEATRAKNLFGGPEQTGLDRFM